MDFQHDVEDTSDETEMKKREGKRAAYLETNTISLAKQKRRQIHHADARLRGNRRVGPVPAPSQMFVVILLLALPVRAVLMLILAIRARLVTVPKVHHLRPVLARQVFPLPRFPAGHDDGGAASARDGRAGEEVPRRPGDGVICDAAAARCWGVCC